MLCILLFSMHVMITYLSHTITSYYDISSCIAKIIINNIITINDIHNGDNTHNQDQVITLHNFNTIKATCNISINDEQPTFK